MSRELKHDPAPQTIDHLRCFIEPQLSSNNGMSVFGKTTPSICSARILIKREIS